MEIRERLKMAGAGRGRPKQPWGTGRRSLTVPVLVPTPRRMVSETVLGSAIISCLTSIVSSPRWFVKENHRDEGPFMVRTMRHSGRHRRTRNRGPCGWFATPGGRSLALIAQRRGANMCLMIETPGMRSEFLPIQERSCAEKTA